MKKIFRYSVLSLLILSYASLTFSNVKFNHKMAVWSAFKGSLFLFSALLLNHSYFKVALFRNVLTYSLEAKGLSHIAKSILDESAQYKFISSEQQQSATHFLDIAHNTSVIGIGAGALGLYSSLQNEKEDQAFWGAILNPWLLYLGGCIAHEIFDDKA